MGSSAGPTILVVDNYDSFVYNLVQYLGVLGARPVVVRNDEVTLAEVERLDPDGILVSPGPGGPEDAGISRSLVTAWAGRVPVLGVCLGHQVIGAAYGARIVRHRVVHGKTSEVDHDGSGVFVGLPSPLVATRYHSLVVAGDSVPDEMVVSATTTDDRDRTPTVMGLRHRTLDVEGVQFHPESVLTDLGYVLLANWLVRCGHLAALAAVPAPPAGPAAQRETKTA